jgi:2-keto-4-pentenoate hydratase
VAATRALLRDWRAALDEGAQRVGWKLGYDFEEIEAVIGDGAVLGYLTSATLLEDGGRFDSSSVRELRAETEVAVRAGGGQAVALELVDVARPPDDLEGIVAGNVAHRAFVLGPERDAVGDYGPVVRTAAALLETAGERLEPGDWVLSGSITHDPVGPGDAATAAVDGLGTVSVTIA